MENHAPPPPSPHAPPGLLVVVCRLGVADLALGDRAEVLEGAGARRIEGDRTLDEGVGAGGWGVGWG